MIKKFAAMLEDIAKIEQQPRKEGRRMNALLAPTGQLIALRLSSKRRGVPRRFAETAVPR